MYPFFIIVAQPLIEVRLQFSKRGVDLLPERDPIELIEHGLMEPLHDAVSLGTFHLGAGMVNILDRSRQLILMTIGTATVLRAPIGENPTQRHLVFLKERHHLIIE